jgi:hypothetical protein
VTRLYCERVDTGFWAEPLNAVTNLAFLGVALLVLRTLRRPPGPAWRESWDLGVAIALLGAVAVGSSLWHTLARPWAERADQAPIALLMVWLFEVTMRRRFGWRAPARASILGIFVAVSAALPLFLPRDTWNGSIFYAPAWLALLGLALAGGGAPMLVTWGLFTASLVLRTIDLPICAAVPAGTHFLWHLANAAVIYRLLAPLVAGARRTAARVR